MRDRVGQVFSTFPNTSGYAPTQADIYQHKQIFTNTNGYSPTQADIHQLKRILYAVCSCSQAGHQVHFQVQLRQGQSHQH
jgi:hypothetical protein